MEDLVLITQRIKEVLAEKSISAYRLAILTGISQPNISRFLNCKIEISIVNFLKICRALDVSADYLLGLSDY